MKADISLSFNREELDEIWMRSCSLIRSASSSISARIAGSSQKDSYGDAHPGQRIFRVENVARICRINIVDQAIAVFE